MVLVKDWGGAATTHPPTRLVQGWRSLESLELFLNSSKSAKKSSGHDCLENGFSFFYSGSEKLRIEKQGAAEA